MAFLSKNREFFHAGREFNPAIGPPGQGVAVVEVADCVGMGRRLFASTSARNTPFDLPHDLHERPGGGGKRSSAFGDEAVVEAEPGRVERQRHEKAVLQFTVDLASP